MYTEDVMTISTRKKQAGRDGRRDAWQVTEAKCRVSLTARVVE